MLRILSLALMTAFLLDIALPAQALDLERRRMLSAKEHVPWRAVGRVNIASYSEQGMCTGTLISEDLVITAAHCVVSDRLGRPYPPGNIHFVAGWRQGQKVADRKAVEITVHPGYRPGAQLDLQQIGSDLALIRLDKPIPAIKAPFFRLAPAPKLHTPLTLISYRRDRAHALTRQDGCDLIGEAEAVLALGCNVTFGASGSPIFADVSGERRLVAVVSAKGTSSGKAMAYAVRVDAAIGDVLARLN